MSHARGKLYAAQPEYANGWWVVSHDEEGYDSVDESGDGGFEKLTARRLVACWNACIGIPTEVLEDEGESCVQVLTHHSMVVEQRDDLLAALKRLHAAYVTSHSPSTRADCWSQAVEAIANAEGNHEQP